jgi:hypothetical protein
MMHCAGTKQVFLFILVWAAALSGADLSIIDGGGTALTVIIKPSSRASGQITVQNNRELALSAGTGVQFERNAPLMIHLNTKVATVRFEQEGRVVDLPRAGLEVAVSRKTRPLYLHFPRSGAIRCHSPRYWSVEVDVDGKRVPIKVTQFHLFQYDAGHTPIAVRIRPYQLLMKNPAFAVVDKIFRASRVTASSEAFRKGGFKLISEKRRLMAGVPLDASHLVVKVYYDRVMELPHESFIARAETAKRMHEVIKQYSLNRIAIPKKWIYLMQPQPAPPKDSGNRIALVQTKLELSGRIMTQRKWQQAGSWDRQLIDQLYTLLSHISLTDCAYRNFQFTKDGTQIALFDLENPTYDLEPFNRGLAASLPKKWKKRWKQLCSGEIQPMR